MNKSNIPQPAYSLRRDSPIEYIPCVEKLKYIPSNNIDNQVNTIPRIFENGNTVVWSDLAKSKFKTIADNNKHTIIDNSIYLNGKQSLTIENGINADCKWFEHYDKF